MGDGPENVRFLNVDLYDFERLRLQIGERETELLWDANEVRDLIKVFRRGRLPLGIATFYLALLLNKHFPNSRTFDSGIIKRTITLGECIATEKPVDLSDESNLTHHLSRYVDYRLKAAEDEHSGTGSIAELLSADVFDKDTSEWCRNSRVQFSLDAHRKKWWELRMLHFPQYLEYWKRANWAVFLAACEDRLVHSLVSEIDKSLDSVNDVLYTFEGKWERATPFLDKELRIFLLASIVGELKQGLVRTHLTEQA